MIKAILWKLLSWADDNWGYSTPLQKRFKPGDKKRISAYKLQDTQLEFREDVIILERGRHDYLVENEQGQKAVVYQFELE